MLIESVEIIGEEPVTLHEAKNYLKIDSINEDDLFISGLITSAREYLEEINCPVLIDKEITIILNSDKSKVKLPFEPIKEVKSIEHDGENYPDYEVIKNYLGECWIEFLTNPKKPLKIKFISGFNQVPKPLWQVILMLVSHWYENREFVVVGKVSSQLDFTVKALIAPYRRIR